MSSRVEVVCVSDLSPLRDAIGSQNTELVNQLIEKDPENNDFRDYVGSMFYCDTPPTEEPGTWCFVVSELIDILHLKSSEAGLSEDWKHFLIWDDYIQKVSPLVEVEALPCLKMLRDGRPLRGAVVDSSEGVLFSWITSTEIPELYASLNEIDVESFEDCWGLSEFHEDLLTVLHDIQAVKGNLVLTAI